MTLLVACLAQGICGQWAIHSPVSYGSGLGGMGAMSGLGGMSGMSGMGASRFGGISSVSMNSAMPNAALRAVGIGGAYGAINRGGSDWDCYRRSGGMLSMCGGAAAAAAAAFKDDYDDTVEEQDESPIGYGAGLLTLAGQVDPALDEEAGKRAMDEIRKLFGASQVPTGNFEGTVVGDMNGLERLSEKAEAMIAAAISGMGDEELTNNAEGLKMDELLDTVKGAQTAVTDQSMAIVEKLNKLINAPMAKKGCAKAEVAEAESLSNSFSQVPERAQVILDEATVFHKDCIDKAMYQLQQYCKTKKLVPVAVEAAHLARDVNSNTGRSMELLKELRTKLKDCRENGVKP